MPRLRTVYGPKSFRYQALYLLDEEGREAAEKYLIDKKLMSKDERLYSVEEKIGPGGGSYDGTPLCFKVARV